MFYFSKKKAFLKRGRTSPPHPEPGVEGEGSGSSAHPLRPLPALCSVFRAWGLLCTLPWLLTGAHVQSGCTAPGTGSPGRWVQGPGGGCCPCRGPWALCGHAWCPPGVPVGVGQLHKPQQPWRPHRGGSSDLWVLGFSDCDPRALSAPASVFKWGICLPTSHPEFRAPGKLDFEIPATAPGACLVSAELGRPSFQVTEPMLP